MFEIHLIDATRNLPPRPKVWIYRALRSGWFDIEAGVYDSRPNGGVCPVAAGAILAGIWADGRLMEGFPDWGTDLAPNEEVEDFAAYFDLCADELGTEAALRLVQEQLANESVLATAGYRGRQAS
ncbi:MAG: hypothetical protein KDB57_04965 [Solirubrobacterales bacterium]|nr:hypothetical protein [Solirubrobacterales bacterium]